MAKDLVRRGWYISFTGVITYKNAPVVQACAKAVPLDRMLVETDAPYLSPVPFRSKTNRSDYIEYTISKIAELVGATEDEIRTRTHDNACKLFSV
jgi:TatD DNase family protein